MSTITAILEPAADGTLHVPVPSELRHAKFKVVAVTQDESDAQAAPSQMAAEEAERQRKLLDVFEQISQSNPFHGKATTRAPHSVLDIAPVSLGQIIRPLNPDDDLLGEMLEDRG